MELIHEALQDPQWKEALMEEMKALEKKKNRTWDLVDKPKEICLLDANGCLLENKSQMGSLKNTRQGW